MAKTQDPERCGTKPKRQRKAFTCTFCKARKIKCNKARPRCSNCERLGRTCNYEVPYWVNTYVQSFSADDPNGTNSNGQQSNGVTPPSYNGSTDPNATGVFSVNTPSGHTQNIILNSTGQPITDAQLQNQPPSKKSSQESTPQAQIPTEGESQSHSLPPPEKLSQLPPTSELPQKPITDILQELEFWKAKALSSNPRTPRQPSLKGSVASTPRFDPSEFGSHGEDLIDFHEQYAQFKNYFGGHKPLSPMFVYKADNYMSLLYCTRYLLNFVSEETLSKQDQTSFEDQAIDPMTDWVSMLGSRTKSNKLKDEIKHLFTDRAELFTSDSSVSTNFRDIEFLKTNIEFILPRKEIFDMLLNFYFQSMWYLRPIVDYDEFMNEISRIVIFQNNLPEINITEKTDFLILAQMLIIIRYASVAISIINPKYTLSEQISPLKEEIISVKAITIAQKCLSICDVIRNTTFQSFQALLLLRFYCKDCPEDGDDLNLQKSQAFFGFLVQHALNLGLHRDPAIYGQSSDIKNDNLRRNIWLLIVDLDMESCILSGSLSTIPAIYFTNVKKQTLNNPDNQSSQSQPPSPEQGDPLFQAGLDETSKNSTLHQIYHGICDSINDLTEKPTLSSLVYKIREARVYVENYYNISSFISTEGINDPTMKKSIFFKNHKILEKNINLLNLELAIYQLLYIQYENSKNVSKVAFKALYKSCLTSVSLATDLMSAYLSGQFDQFIDHSFSDFALNPLITALTNRTFNSVFSSMLRSLHGRELLMCHLYTPGSNIDTDNYLSFVQPICNIWEAYLKIYENTVGSKYLSGLKLICSRRFTFMYLKADRFSWMDLIIDFCEADIEYERDLSIYERKQEVRNILQQTTSMFSIYSQWLQLSKSYEAAMKLLKPDVKRRHKYCYAICNLSHTNQTAEFFENDIADMINAVRTNIKYVPDLLKFDTYVGDDHPDKKGIPPSETTDTVFGTLTQDSSFHAQMAFLMKGTIGVPSETDNNNIIDIFGPTVEVKKEMERLLTYL
ncbi:hypothetical protein BN7_5065 [Wickerhamomyces ciferrii]|uniref:Zn(2)-C6 fungal-type domain-containing protein n=1 Tax=Wickerhamomyces ciferrii (strain ATCC 14091 / BCRC 22168 / CBS 111 / JCM 3599 / NBRC 0793 / NRRL Y-1031 F-60-10) TaxID=1206466 RepID=K0KWF6_WICCF|nr:uncharacterized protein BN7_5065 [Wickerhamomyces ciferrii]CCH45483.1 hypothetical protein BN7_5065 [Wickerhamomyces ciferrii]